MTQPEYSPILKQNSTMAIISLISGIASYFILPIIGHVVAIITGNIALKEIKKSNGMIVGENFARIGIVTGWVGLAIYVICGFLSVVTSLLTSVAGLGVCGIFPFLTQLIQFFQHPFNN
jgi:hypothetical protein